MSSVRSRLGFTGLPSKQLAGEWEPFKRQVDGEILTQLWVFPHGGVIFTISLQSLSFTVLLLANLLCLIFNTEDNFLKAAVGKKGKRKNEEKRGVVPTERRRKKGECEV